MAVRHFLISTLVLLSLSRVDRRRAKMLMRNAAIRFCHRLLSSLCPQYRIRTGPCIVFAPHQDDETLGCGGLIARKRHEGLPVHVIFITDGAASHPGHPRLSSAAIRALRHREALAALAILGVESGAIHFLDEADGMLDSLDPTRGAMLVERITTLLRDIGPEEVFLPCSPDGSTEHDAAFRFVSAALQQTTLRPDVWQYPVWSWWNPLLLFERMIFTTGRCALPTEDYQPVKALALHTYRSQVEATPPWLQPTLPPELVSIFGADREFFFRYRPPAPGQAEIKVI